MSEDSPSLEDQIFDAYESGVGLVWFVQALILIGEARPDPHHRLRLLEMLQSMLAYKGIDSGLIGAIEGTKHAMPEFVGIEAELRALRTLPPGASKEEAERELLSVLSNVGLIPTDGPEAAELRTMMLQIADLELPEHQKARVQQALHDRLAQWRATGTKKA